MELIHVLYFNILYKTDFPLSCTYFSACAEQKKWNKEGQGNRKLLRVHTLMIILIYL